MEGAWKKVVVHKTIKARAMWNLIAQAAWKSAEPGVVFMSATTSFITIGMEQDKFVNPCGKKDCRRGEL